MMLKSTTRRAQVRRRWGRKRRKLRSPVKSPKGKKVDLPFISLGYEVKSSKVSSKVSKGKEGRSTLHIA